jgi:hypothetical protein
MGGGGAGGTTGGGGGGGQTGGVEDAEGGSKGNFGAYSLPGGFCQNNAVGSYPVSIGNEQDGYVTIELLTADTTYYMDNDGDGYGDGSKPVPGLSGCIPPGYVVNSIDCDDTNPAINPTTTWYKDVDGDGYSDGTTITQCARPSGYKLSSELTATSGDCDDDNAALNPATVWYKDADNDGYSDGSTIIRCTRPTGYKLSSELTSISGDCDDNDATLNPATVWYRDADNDGYSDGTIITQCARPVGYKLSAELTESNVDCDDNNPTLNPATVWYKDADNDSYSDGIIITQCTRPVGYKLATELTATTGDCNDNDPSFTAAITYYQDNDKDGYGNPSVTLSSCTAAAPDGYVVNNTDCNDNDATVNPAAVEICGNNSDDNCDGQVDEATCYFCLNASSTRTLNIMATTARLSWSAMANPAQWQLRYKIAKPDADWMIVTRAGNIRSLSISDLQTDQRYSWKIRAFCNGQWTDFLRASDFMTGNSFTINSGIAGNAEDPTLQVYPNPTYRQFVIDLQYTQDVNTLVKIDLVNLQGQAVMTENVNLVNGRLHKVMNIPPSVSKGIYLLKITSNADGYVKKLFYE